jgi:aminocarboxymuconate-semialdehyde decarboxylase
MAKQAKQRARPARGTRVVDTHAHWFPPEWMALIEAEGNRNGAVVKRTENGLLSLNLMKGTNIIAPPMFEIDLRLKAMDKQGIDVHALSLCAPMVYWAPPEFGLRLSQAFNNACSAAHLAHPQRFFGLAMLPMQAPELALEELNRAATLPGMRGVYMATNVNGRNLDEPDFFPVYERCEQLRWPICLHPVDTLGLERISKYHLRNLLGIPYEHGVAAASLVFGGVLDAFPKLDVMLSHAGGAFPWLIGRMNHGAKVRAELKHMKRPPEKYLRRFTYDTITHSDRILKYLIDMVGADRVMVGSDYCFDMGYTRPVDVVKRLAPLSATDRELVLGGTAARLFRLR